VFEDERIKAELLYLEACPNYERTEQLLREVMAE